MVSLGAWRMSAEPQTKHLRLVDESAPSPLDLATIYREHGSFVVRMVRQQGVLAAHVEDVVHDVFMVVHRRLADFDGRASVRAWLYGIARRVVLHHRRSHARTQRREAWGLMPNQVPDPESTAAAAQAAAWVERFLLQLDEPQRMAFSLVDIEGLSAVEVARTLRVNVNTVYSRLRLARKRFDRALAELEAPEVSR